MKILLKVSDNKAELVDYEDEFDRIYEKAYAEGLKEGRAEAMAEAAKAREEIACKDIRAARTEGYAEGYLAGKRDGEHSKIDLPDEIKNALDNIAEWLRIPG